MKTGEEELVDLRDIRSVKGTHSISLLCRPGVVGVGIGRKKVQGNTTKSFAITILVQEKIRRCLLRIEDRLPGELEGVPTDVISINGKETLTEVYPRSSRISEDNRTRRWRPAPAGVSIGHYLLQDAGTLGAWVTDLRSGEPLLLSCWHVIANSGRCKKGDPVLQPAVSDGGKLPGDVIGYLDRWIDVEMLVPTRNLNDAQQRLRELMELKSSIPTNKIDAAVARPISDSVVSREILGIGRVQPPGESEREPVMEIGTHVVKSGRTTGVTRGAVSLTNVDIFVKYDTGVALFVDQCMVAGASYQSEDEGRRR